MSQSLSKMWSHLIFSTKERYPFLADKETREQLHAYMAAILRNHDWPTLQIGGAADHIHALFALSKNSSIAQVVYEVKHHLKVTFQDEYREFLRRHDVGYDERYIWD
jgi:putative transposase